MKLRRIFAGILSAGLLLGSTSCGIIIVNDMSSGRGPRDEQAETEAGTPESSEASPGSAGKTVIKYSDQESGRALSGKYLSELPERDYDGAIFFLTTPTVEYIAPENVNNTVSKLAVERNAQVEELLDIKLIPAIADADTMYSEMMQAIAADTYYTDLLMLPIYQTGRFRLAGTLMNMRTVPFFDLEQPYFNQESSDMTSGGYSTYGVAGHASIAPKSFAAVLMNVDILKEAGMDGRGLYADVVDGRWTWDTLLTCTEAVNTLNESREEKLHTVTSQNPVERLPDLIFKSSGNDYIITGQRQVPVIGFTRKTAAVTMSNMKKIYTDPNAVVGENDTAVTDFAEGRSAFLVDYLYILPWLTNSTADWGLLPLPKEAESDEYRTLIANNELIFAIPENHTNAEFAAITLSALNAASYGYIYDEYVQYSMIHVLRDNDSVNMLDLILDTASFDFAFAFGNAYPAIGDATYRVVRECAATNNLSRVLPERSRDANAVMKESFDLRY